MNNESLNDLDNDNENGNNSTDVDFEMQSSDLEAISAIYDRVRDQLQKYNVGDNEENIKDFENLTSKIADEMKEVMNGYVDI